MSRVLVVGSGAGGATLAWLLGAPAKEGAVVSQGQAAPFLFLDLSQLNENRMNRPSCNYPRSGRAGADTSNSATGTVRNTAVVYTHIREAPSFGMATDK